MTQPHAERIAEIKALTEDDRHDKTPAVEAALEYLLVRVARADLALREIARGEGPFNRDQLTHAENRIESMQKLAVAALADYEADEPEKEK